MREKNNMSHKITLDDLIMYYNKPRSFEFLYAITIIPILMIIITLSIGSSNIITIIYLITLLFFIHREIKRMSISQQMYKALDRLYDELPLNEQLKCLNNTEKRWTKCAINALECHHIHLPGDCENCGAE